MDIQNVPLPSRLEAMKNGSLDITAVSEPWTTRFAAAGYTSVWKGMEEVLPNLQFSVNIYGPKFSGEEPASLARNI